LIECQIAFLFELNKANKNKFKKGYKMKKKIGLILIISFFCLLMGISSVRADSKLLYPNQYWGLGKNMNFADTLNFRIECNGGANIYIMTTQQMQIYQNDPQDTASAYYKEWKGVLVLTDSFIAPEDGDIWIIMINQSDTENTRVIIDASIDYYYPPEPEVEIEYVYRYTYVYDTISQIFATVISIIFIGAVGTLLLILRKKNKKIRELQGITK